jgi:site-specific DNA-cytosine methylase
MINKKVSQINPNKESGGKQPYQQNRIYDTEGLAPALCANKSDLLIDAKIVVHNTMPRSSTTGKGGTGPLSRADGKTYCLDIGNTNAIEITEKYPHLQKSDGNNNVLFHRKGFKTNTQTYGVEGKCGTLDTAQGGGRNAHTLINSRIRRLTPKECERLQTVEDEYTNHVSDSQRYKMLGNGWTVDVISHIFSYLKTQE